MQRPRITRGTPPLIVIALLLAAATAFAQADVNKVLDEARQALGGQKKLEALKTITVTGRSLRTTPTGSSSEGDFEMALELPDKFVRRDVLAAMGNMSVYRMSGFNGDGVINEIDTPPQLAGGGNMIFRVATAGPGGAPGDPATQTPEQKEARRQAALQSAKRDFARLALGMLVTSLPSYPLTFTHGGTAESPDGTADVIDVKGQDFAARLFIDGKTHLPLMLSWMDKEPLRMVRSVGGPGGAGGTQTMVMAGPGHGAVAGGGGATFNLPAPTQGAKPPTPEETEKLQKQMAEQVKEAEAKRRTVEYRLYYSDYQAVDGVRLPHRIQSSVDGKPTEEITFEKVKVNQKIDAKRFTVSK